MALPQRCAQIFVGKWEVQPHREPAFERGIDRTLEVRREDREALERIEALEEIVHFEVRVGGIFSPQLAAFREQRVRLVEQEHELAFFGRIEYLAEVLLGLA